MSTDLNADLHLASYIKKSNINLAKFDVVNPKKKKKVKKEIKVGAN